MNNIYFIGLVSLFLGCKSQTSILHDGVPSEEHQPGGCYFSYILKDEVNEKIDKPFVLEIVPTKFIEVDKKINPNELKEHKFGSDTYYFEYSQAHFKYVFRDQDLPNYAWINQPTGYLFCLIEVPPQTKSISKDELIKSNYVIKQNRVSERNKITKRYVKAKPNHLSKNERYFPSGTWSEPKRAIGPYNY